MFIFARFLVLNSKLYAVTRWSLLRASCSLSISITFLRGQSSSLSPANLHNASIMNTARSTSMSPWNAMTLMKLCRARTSSKVDENDSDLWNCELNWSQQCRHSEKRMEALTSVETPVSKLVEIVSTLRSKSRSRPRFTSRKGRVVYDSRSPCQYHQRFAEHNTRYNSLWTFP